MYTKLVSETVVLTYQYVYWFAHLPVYGGDRDREGIKGKRRIAWLRQKHNNKQFYEPEWAIVEFNGIIYRANGGHSSWMLLQILLEGLKLNIETAHVKKFKADTHTDMALLFQEFDNQKSARDDKDTIKANLAAEPILERSSTDAVKKIISGIGFYMSVRNSGQKGLPKIDQETRNGFIHQYSEFIQSVEHLAHGAETKKIANQGVLAAVFATYLDNPELSKKFWLQVVKENNADPKDQTRMLASWLGKNNSTFYCYKKDSIASAKMRMCCGVWNKWKKGIKSELRMPHKIPENLMTQDVMPQAIAAQIKK